MPQPMISVSFHYEPALDEQHPVIRLQFSDYTIEMLANQLRELGFAVIEDLANACITVTAKQATDQHKMSLRLVKTLMAWHQEYCGYCGIDRVLYVSCNMPLINQLTIFPPTAESKLRLLGELHAKLDLAIVTEDYESAAGLQRQFNQLAEELHQSAT